jgi:hypothetical protein
MLWRCMGPRFVDTSWRWVVSFTPRPLYHKGKGPRYPLVGSWVAPRASLDAAEKIPDSIRTPDSDPSVVQPIASRYTNCAIILVTYEIIYMYVTSQIIAGMELGVLD